MPTPTEGRVKAILPCAGWHAEQHDAASLMSAIPLLHRPWVKALLHSVYDQPDTTAFNDQFDRIVDAAGGKLPNVAEHRKAARADILAFTSFPSEAWRQIWSNKPVVATCACGASPSQRCPLSPTRGEQRVDVTRDDSNATLLPGEVLRHVRTV